MASRVYFEVFPQLLLFRIISYDISQDRRRTKIHECLKSYGRRIQFSMFECHLEKLHLLRLKARLKNLIDAFHAGDNVRYFFTSASRAWRG